jgi:serine/threonine protein kinase
MTGETICQYRILAKMGEGGMGAVYEAEDTKLGRNAALKFLIGRDEEQRERFSREAQAAAGRNLPNICTWPRRRYGEGAIRRIFPSGPRCGCKVFLRSMDLNLPAEEKIEAASRHRSFGHFHHTAYFVGGAYAQMEKTTARRLRAALFP